MKSSIDNKSPRQATHLKTKAKKNALMMDRFKQIETENRLLLEKMSNIMRVSVVKSFFTLQMPVLFALSSQKANHNEHLYFCVIIIFDTVSSRVELIVRMSVVSINIH